MSNLVSPTEREAQRRECANQAQDHRREVDDLTQQTRAAEAVENANKIAWTNYNLARIQLVISILGTGALAWSLILTSKATDAAVRGEDLGFAAVRAAQEANRITQAANVVDQRPWLHVEVTSLTNAKAFTSPVFAHNGERAFTATVNFKIINTGKTPAQEVEVLVKGGTAESVDQAALKALTTPKEMRSRTVGVVPPNSALELDFPAFRPFSDILNQYDFTFGASLLFIVQYTTRSLSSPGTSHRTTQIFIIEHDDGLRKTNELSTRDIKVGHGKLVVRPSIGLMA